MLAFDRLGKQHIVFEMHMAMEILLEAQFCEADAIRCAAVGSAV
jgi:hypothetical protein